MLPLVLDKNDWAVEQLAAFFRVREGKTTGGMERKERHNRSLCNDTTGGQEAWSEVWRHRAGGLSDGRCGACQPRIGKAKRARVSAGSSFNPLLFLKGICTTPLQMT